MTNDNLPLVFPDSGISEDDINTLYDQAGVDSAEIPDTNGPPPTTPPYNPGTCGLQLKQSKTANTDKTDEYTLEPTMTDDQGKQIGYDSPETVVPTDPYNMQSKLEYLLEMTPSTSHHGEVSFVLGEQVWDTTQNDAKKIPYCDKTPNGDTKTYNCKFTCGWGGGKSSDGSN